MKKISILLGTMLALVMTSCGGSLFGDDLISKEGIDKAKEVLTKDPFGNKEFNWVELKTKEALNSKFDEVATSYYDPAVQKDVKQTYNSTSKLSDPETSQLSAIEDKIGLNKNKERFKVSEIPFDKLVSEAQDAIKFFGGLKETAEYEDFNVNEISMKKENGKLKTVFKIDMTKKGEGSYRQGRQRVTNYYEVRIFRGENGEWELVTR
nr:hypothetical protein [uncultured Capnocytophaga sp.]